MVTIYALICTANGKAYIGCTANLAKRFREHRSLLNHGKHSEPDLMADWLIHGPRMFRMEMLYDLDNDVSLHTKRLMEKFAMQRFKENGLLYNRNEACFEPTKEARAKGSFLASSVIGMKWSEDARRKRSIAQLGIPKNHGQKISATKLAKKLMR